ncbi:MAG: electron transfer flavoprotein subunit beta/FixA family protein [Chloroflexota bacterium]
MNIIVCIKQVPGTTEVKINPETNTLVREGIKNVINPFDTYALEEAIRLKERFGGKVTVLCMGPPQADESLKEAISLGADEAILLSDRAFAGADTWATAFTLGAAVKKIGQFDIIICGKQTLDGDTGQVGPEICEMLGIPFVGYVSKIDEIANGKMKVQRLIEEGHEIIESPVPAVISVTKEINVPRLPSLRGIMRAKNATVTVWKAADMGVDASQVGLAGSSTKVIKIFFPKRVSKVEKLTGEAESQVERLVEKLKEAGLV